MNSDFRMPYSQRYTNYVLLLIMLVAMFNTCDRTIISVLVDDIKVDLNFDDRQMGFLMGMAFSITYFIAGIPIAAMADRTSRVRIVSIAIAIWSAMTALTGSAQTFVQMTLCRMGVGLGEAGGSPPSQSLITDYVKPSKRAKAMSLLAIGSIAGAGFGVVYGGWAADSYGWRMALISIAVPGMAISLLFFFTVKEPPRRPSEAELTATASSGNNTKPSKQALLTSLKQLAGNPSFVYLLISASLITVTSMGRTFWEPTFMRRIYELSAEQAGIHYFLIGPIPAAIGAFAFAILTDRLGKRDIRWYAWIPAATTFVLIPLSLIFYFISPKVFWLGIPVGYYFSFAASLVAAGWTPAIMSLAQSIVSSNQRALSAATWSMVGSLVGSGIGPFIVGDLNVRLEPHFGVDAIRYSLSALYFAPLLAIFFLLKLGKSIDPISAVQKNRTIQTK